MGFSGRKSPNHTSLPEGTLSRGPGSQILGSLKNLKPEKQIFEQN